MSVNGLGQQQQPVGPAVNPGGPEEGASAASKKNEPHPAEEAKAAEGQSTSAQERKKGFFRTIIKDITQHLSDPENIKEDLTKSIMYSVAMKIIGLFMSSFTSLGLIVVGFSIGLYDVPLGKVFNERFHKMVEENKFFLGTCASFFRKIANLGVEEKKDPSVEKDAKAAV
jgi:hypothetical protein